MKTNLLICFLSITSLTFGQRDREIIKQIDSINSTALIYYDNNDIVKSFNGFNKAKALSETIKDDYGNAIANYSLGNIYILMQNDNAAENCYKAMLKSAKYAKDDHLIANAYISLGKLYKSNNAFENAISYFENALKYGLNIVNDNEKQQIQAFLFDVRINLSEAYINNNQLAQALISLLKIEENLKSNTASTYSNGYFNYIYGLYFVKQDLYNNANSRFKEAITFLEEDNKNLKLLSKAYEELSLSSAKSGNNEDAYIALLKHNNYRDRFLNEEELKKDLVTKSKFLIEDYKNNAHLANIEKLEQQQANNKIKMVNLIISITLLLLFASLITLYVSYTSKRKLSKTLEIRNMELERTKEQALKSSELKSKFISNVSHELRTPLYGVVGITSLLLSNNNLSYRDTKLLKSLKYSGDYLLNLINDILQVSKMENQKVELKNISVNVKDLLESIANTFEYRLQETNNKIKIYIDSYVPEYIKCDSVRLSQVLINLIGNSVKFTESGTINLRARLMSLDNNQVGLRFEVEDDGIGIPEEKFKTIFNNFSQLEDESNFNYQGTGLGLSITKKLIELFESKIELESEVGKGSKFSFNVNFEIDNSRTNAISDSDNKQNNIISGSKKYRILVAEDNKINQIVTKNLLNKEGYLCTIANNGLEAIEQIKNNNFDLILMDINMPLMNGNEATMAIRKFNDTIPVIALTAADIEEVKEDHKNIGYDDIITKPFDNYEFYQIISANINKQRDITKFIKAS
ncbi:tetratricopeptide repeat-containing hybrid sensor histidine kinase/response regulator [Confluentibacter citreus]|uniref:tetratricopeptide repeat-containing hybrid sensor histidine kinase/response regulator n=1 Tax=Confluentibacter citreus TaxID=2007307 RepID=UPI000C28A717|nr:response regulator [Confluentibacter citreus]